MDSEANILTPGVTRGGAGPLVLAWLIATMSLWMFAFYEVPSGADDWIRRAQIACFGSDESGIPGTAGWMLLILSPLAFLGAIILTLHDEIRLSLRELLISRSGRWFLGLIVLLVVAETIWVTISIRARLERSTVIVTEIPAHLPATYPRGDKPAPDFKLIDQHGNSQSLSALSGKPVLLSFVFAHCQAVCPTLIKTIQLASNNSGGTGVTSMFVTLDPWRDSPAALPGLAKEWGMGANTYVLSGTPKEVNAVLDAYQVPRSRDGQSGDVVHPAIVHIIDKKGILAYSFNNPTANWLRDALAQVSK